MSGIGWWQAGGLFKLPKNLWVFRHLRFGSALRRKASPFRGGADFAGFLRKTQRVNVFFPGTCPWKNQMINRKFGTANFFDKQWQARACFFVVGSPGAPECRRTIRNRAFRHFGSGKKFLKKLFKNLLTLSR